MRKGFRLYDTHTHIGTARHSGRVDTAEAMLRRMDAFGVERSLLIPFPVVEDHRAQHDEIGRAVQQWPERFSGAACLYPFIPEQEFRDEVRRCREVYGFRALKLQPQYQGLNVLLPSSDFFFDTAHQNGLCVVAHTGSGIPFSLPSLFMIPARKFPDLKIILAHCGGGILAAEAIVAAQFCPNIYLELSSLLPHQIHEVLRFVPADRVMNGSDLPENLESEMEKVLNLEISAADKQQILYGTACRVIEAE